MHGTKVFDRSQKVANCNQRPTDDSAADFAGSEQPIVFVVDDNVDVREGAKQLVESVGLRCEVFTSPREFLRRCPTNGPVCLVLDVRLPEMNGLDLQAQLAKNIPIIVITGHGDIPMSVRAMQQGAIDFLIKPVGEQQLIDAIHAGLEQHRARLEQEIGFNGLRARFQSLTPREKEILPLVVSGLLNKQIAAEVGLSEVTVKVHRHKMMAKLNAKSVPDLVRMAEALAIRNGGSRQRDLRISRVSFADLNQQLRSSRLFGSGGISAARAVELRRPLSPQFRTSDDRTSLSEWMRLDRAWIRYESCDEPCP